MNNFIKELDVIERLIKDGYFGEARFTVRRILLDQKQKFNAEKLEDQRFIDFLGQLQHKLLMYESLTDVQRIISMIQRARHQYHASRTPIAPSQNPGAFRGLFSGRSLCTLFKAQIKTKG